MRSIFGFIIVALTIVALMLPVYASDAGLIEDAPASAPVTAIDATGTGVLTATAAPISGSALPAGPDVTVGEGVQAVGAIVKLFKSGQWQIGIGALIMLALALFRRVYMGFLKKTFSKPVRKIVIIGTTLLSLFGTAIINDVGLWAAFQGAFFTTAAGVMIWELIGGIPFVKKLTGKAKEKPDLNGDA